MAGWANASYLKRRGGKKLQIADLQSGDGLRNLVEWMAIACEWGPHSYKGGCPSEYGSGIRSRAIASEQFANEATHRFNTVGSAGQAKTGLGQV